MRIAISVFVIASLTGSVADIEDMPPELHKDMACMTRVLQAIPGIDDVKTGAEDVRGPAPAAYDVEMSADVQKPDVEKQRYIEYRVQEADGATVLRFAALRYAKADGVGYGYSFQIGLSGLSGEGLKPRTYRTFEVISAWKAQCGVEAWVLFV
jgi:hypothetical protein